MNQTAVVAFVLCMEKDFMATQLDCKIDRQRMNIVQPYRGSGSNPLTLHRAAYFRRRVTDNHHFGRYAQKEK